MKKYLLCLIATLATFCLFGQSRFDDVKIIPTKLTDQIYMLKGAGGNIGIILGDEGVLMIDNQYGPLSEKIKKAIGELSEGQINYVVNTHWHGDHTGGNENFGNDGATIIAHQNVRKRMSEEQKRDDRITPPSPDIALPKITFGDDLQIFYNDQKIMAIHTHDAHTDGDAFIWIPGSNVMHLGDCFFHKRYPFVDRSSGGSVIGLIEAIKVALLLVDDKTQIIPGHGPLANKNDLEEYLKFLQVVKRRIEEYSSVGKGLHLIDNDKVVEGYEDWSWGFINAETLVRIFYKSLTED